MSANRANRASRVKRRRLLNDLDAELIEQNIPNAPPNVTEPAKVHETTTTGDAQPASQSSDPQKSTDTQTVPANDESASETCRLRHGLNEDCLCEIFKYLGVYDLIQLCNLDVYYQNLITQYVISKKRINFTKMEPCWTTNKIFQVFGKSMRKIKIAEENTRGVFELFLNFVTQYCSVGGLTEMELRFSEPTAKEALMQKSLPYFTNLRKLVLHDNYMSVTYKEYLALISVTATNLTHLTLEGVNVSGEWLLSAGMDNLRELRLQTSKRRSMRIQTVELSEFLRTKTKLELFSYIGNDDVHSVIDTLTAHCPKLRVFADFHLTNTYRDVMAIGGPLKFRYNAIRFFENVKVLGLTTYTRCGSDLFYPLEKLAAQNKVESLKIFMNRDEALELDEANRKHYCDKSFAHFTRLNAVELQIRSEASEQCEMDGEFIREFISKQMNVEKFCLISEHAVRDVNKVIDAAPNLNELNVSRTKMKYLPVEIRKIVLSIRKRRANLITMGEIDPPPFHVIVNEQQWRELQVYKDVDIILTTTTTENIAGCQTFKVSGP